MPVPELPDQSLLPELHLHQQRQPGGQGHGPVSYTHLDVYKRQVQWISGFFQGCWIIIQAVWAAVSGWFKTNVIDPVVKDVYKRQA